MLHELGILFNIDDLVEPDYQTQAWKIFMTTCDPAQLAGSTLYEGEIIETSTSHEDAFCIALQTQDRHVINYLKSAFMRHEVQGLMPKEQRFIERGVTLRYPLSIRGQIDANGQFRSWQEAFTRRDKQLCLETAWKFGGPAKTPIATEHGPVLVEEAYGDEFVTASVRPRPGSGPG
ncbi:hypothetical protein L0337_46110 [candidate division KSB1 bacterium]|nr:hypothetical protein [candidate division KSB1 bacterium]